MTLITTWRDLFPNDAAIRNLLRIFHGCRPGLGVLLLRRWERFDGVVTSLWFPRDFVEILPVLRVLQNFVETLQCFLEIFQDFPQILQIFQEFGSIRIFFKFFRFSKFWCE